MAINHLALDVRNSGRSLLFSRYPADSKTLPASFLKRLSEINVSLEFEEPLYVTSSGFCPAEGVVKVVRDAYVYKLTLRSPDCRVVQ